MSATPVIWTCDSCGRDLTATSYEQGFRLVLRSEAKRHRSGAVYATNENQPIEEQHFCELRCLQQWVAAGLDGAMLEAAADQAAQQGLIERSDFYDEEVREQMREIVEAGLGYAGGVRS